MGLTGIAAIFVLQGVFNTLWTSQSETEARRMQESSIASIELVARIARDVDQQRILLDNHIFEARPSEMARIEAQLQAYGADLDAARVAFRPLVDLADELATWQQAEREIVGFRQAMAAALAFSRENRDNEARTAMATVLEEYADLDQHLAELIQINSKSASESVTRIKHVERSATAIVMGSHLIALILLIFIARWSLRTVTLYDAQQVRLLRILEERNRELDAFAGRIAHDLRGPLASLNLTTDLLSRGAAAEQAAPIERLRRVVKRVATMIDDLLTLSRVAPMPKDESCDAALVAARLGEDFGERFGDQATLRLDVAPAGVCCSEGLLRQALWNLIENGVKYRRGDLKAQVTVIGRVEADTYELRVTDNGMGMSAEDAEHAFEAFYRSADVRGVAGTGLGLSIVKRVVDARRGTVAIESRLGQGTTFVVRLPLARPPDKRPSPRPLAASGGAL